MNLQTSIMTKQRMKVTNLKVNHLSNPIGYQFPNLHFGWNVIGAEGKNAVLVHIRVWEMRGDGRLLLLDKEEKNLVTAGTYEVKLPLSPRTRYTWSVEISTDAGEICQSEEAWFETGKMEEKWTAKWITAPPKEKSIWVSKELKITKAVRKASLYICGLGLYEVYVDEEKVGKEFLMPGYHSYDFVQEYQTYCITDYLKQGNQNLNILLGNGWYRGRFVYEGGFENLYGDRLKVIAELHLLYEDGTEEVVSTDTSWEARTSYITDNNIYDGEIQDYQMEGRNVEVVCEELESTRLVERTSVPLKETEILKPKEIIHTPTGEFVLDFGETITGWVTFCCKEKNGKEIRLQYGEWMENGEFYRDNLRTAKAEFSYLSDGNEIWVRPHFTYYGFRYVKVCGVEEVSLEDYQASRIRSACDQNGTVVTGNVKVNRLIKNAYASQECNFLDIPTDCPQRDERMGWTGDIAVFADTACFNMNCAAFLEHFLVMTEKEQEALHGSMPLFVPRPKPVPKEGEELNPTLTVTGASVWGDAATIIPWTLYEHYGDRSLLKRYYPIMKRWVDYVRERTMANKIPYLWQNDIQLGDWLALDSEDPNGLFGKTDTGFVATAYYYHSVELTSKAARVLGLQEEEKSLREDKEKIRKAFESYYLDVEGKLTISETQTAYALMLSYGLCPPQWLGKMKERLKTLIQENGGHLTTGFAGTPLLCPALSENGEHETACALLLQEEYPGWLYEVNLGAVTIWERWNSVNQDGTMSDTGMNSLNHYAYGSIVSWIYRYLCGFNPCIEQSNTLTWKPGYCEQLGFLKGSYQTPWGVYQMEWEEIENNQVKYTITVPFDGKAFVEFPGCKEEIEKGIYTYVREKISGN